MLVGLTKTYEADGALLEVKAERYYSSEPESTNDDGDPIEVLFDN